MSENIPILPGPTPPRILEPMWEMYRDMIIPKQIQETQPKLVIELKRAFYGGMSALFVYIGEEISPNPGGAEPVDVARVRLIAIELEEHAHNVREGKS